MGYGNWTLGFLCLVIGSGLNIICLVQLCVCVCPTADVWSVGCVMAELLTGQTLFPGNDCILELSQHKARTHTHTLTLSLSPLTYTLTCGRLSGDSLTADGRQCGGQLLKKIISPTNL